jgi:hypothetical protein
MTFREPSSELQTAAAPRIPVDDYLEVARVRREPRAILPQCPLVPSLNTSVKTFLDNVEAVRTFAHEIARLADEHDRRQAQESMINMLRVLGAPEDKLNEFAASVPKSRSRG